MTVQQIMQKLLVIYMGKIKFQRFPTIYHKEK